MGGERGGESRRRSPHERSHGTPDSKDRNRSNMQNENCSNQPGSNKSPASSHNNVSPDMKDGVSNGGGGGSASTTAPAVRPASPQVPELVSHVRTGWSTASAATSGASSGQLSPRGPQPVRSPI